MDDKQPEEAMVRGTANPLEALDQYEEFIAKLRANPHFVVAEPRGEGFIITGQPPSRPKPQCGDE
jgi:hypothetical protein